jgi:leucyl aminopeptidase (aminopeptidase T)
MGDDNRNPKNKTLSPPSSRASVSRIPTSPSSGPRKPSTPSLRLPIIDFELANASARIVEGALGLAAGEHIVIMVDKSRQDMGSTLTEVARAMGAKATLALLEDFGDRPHKRVPDRLKDLLATAQATVLLAGFEEGEQSMRVELVAELVRKLNLRHAHMIGVSRQAMLTGFSVDPTRVLDATRAVRTRLRPDSVLRLRTTAGSDFEVKLHSAHRWMEHVGVIRPGRWENLPSGEIVTCPAEGHGVFVADASVGAHFGQAAGLLADKPIRLEIEGSVCKSVRCSDLSLQLAVERFLRSDSHSDRLGAVGLGTNVGINTAVGTVSCDQNMPGLTIGFGSTFREQTGASWDARTQITFAGSLADVDLDGAPLLRQGRYIFT